MNLGADCSSTRVSAGVRSRSYTGWADRIVPDGIGTGRGFLGRGGAGEDHTQERLRLVAQDVC